MNNVIMVYKSNKKYTPSKMGEPSDYQYSNLDELLIALVRERPALYDIRVPERERTKSAKQNLWYEISQQMEGCLKPDAAELRWKYLRENFLKARNKQRLKEELAEQNGLPVPTARNGKYSFRYYAIMEFLSEPVDYQKSLSLNNAIKCKTKLSSQIFHNNQRSSTNSLAKMVPKTNSMNSTGTMVEHFDELDSEMQQNSLGSPFSQETSEYEDSTNKSSDMSSYDQIFLECLQKPIEKPSPIDGFLIRLGEGLKRLPYKERSKLELEFLIRLREVEEQLETYE
ncbi:uncharacterized protein LOC100116323 [Nasonia vitripennis]|uniref:MADF domain-containing protein n=1 Tax=Nasonia vitripennis TaxID=7425 RepID=A0A7M7H6A9_NASVI|nr:uncharacterized protein LOC100116323 [Nasonia vitripennis]XP_008208285.1 uncharacterized protein LOC100116323 [Nasonia vitripennis]XP_008208287.1 uncharacterized protein LOC100116323 [Nasonia vitripennis]XP_031789549.1 uncharacterized protein LOC100116323 [Nasonia vitripennis]